MIKCSINLSSILEVSPANRKWKIFGKFIFEMLESLAEWRHLQIKDKPPQKLEIASIFFFFEISLNIFCNVIKTSDFSSISSMY